MSNSQLPIGSSVTLEKGQLQVLIDALQAEGYRVVGPQLADGAVIMDDLSSVDQLPAGWLDEQDGGSYRMRKDEDAGYFDYVVGPHSLKQYVFPPSETIQELTRQEGQWRAEQPEPDSPSTAVIGARSCDLKALAIQDKVFLEGPYVDTNYQKRRERLFLIGVQCRRAAATCFCHSMKSGPRATAGFDLALSELESEFVIQVGSDRGGQLLAKAGVWELASTDQVEQSEQQSAQLLHELKQRDASPASEQTPRPRSLDTSNVRDLLLDNIDHPHWQDVAERCLSCANCTMVCPTCFCSSIDEVTDLTGEHVQRERQWSSCFNSEHSYTSSGVVHRSTASRYRQWLTHKLATWQDQFGTSGCVGCGRCITWCPVGIDLTQEVAAIRKSGE